MLVKRNRSTLIVEGLTVQERLALKPQLCDARIEGDRIKCSATRRSLAALGLDTPPITQAQQPYTFAFKTPCYDHQAKGFEATKDKTAFAILWEMGLGKAKAAIDIAAYKYSHCEIDCLLVVTLRGVHRNWIDKECPQHMDAPYTGAAWHSSRVGNGVTGIENTPGLVVVAINFDAIWRPKGDAFVRRLCKTRRVMMVVDESQGIKSPTARRAKALINLAPLSVCRFIMTGTPVLDSPLDVWSQFQFLDPAIFSAETFYTFKQRYAVEEPIPGVTHLEWRHENGNRFQVEVPTRTVVGYKNMDDMRARMAPYTSRYTKDILGLPPKIYRTHTYELSTHGQRAYKSMCRDLLIELSEDRYVTAQLAITKLVRLRQLLCGFARPDGDTTIGEAFETVNPRMSALMDVVEAVQHKAIIWATFRYSIAEIVKTLTDKFGKNAVVEYSGRINDDYRQAAIQAFQYGDARWFVGQQSAAGTGLTLTAARDVIYYNNDFSLGLRLQSEDRAHRIGQENSVTYTDIEAYGSVDTQIIEGLRGKMDLAALVTGDTVREWLSR